MKLLAFSDPQVGVFETRSYGSLAEQEQVLSRILEVAREERVAAVLFGGDGFHSRKPSPDTMLAFERPLIEHKTLAPEIEVIGIPGNHDLQNLALGSGLDVFGLAGLLSLYRTPAVHYAGGGIFVACLPSAPVHQLVASQDGGDRQAIYDLAAEHLLRIAEGLLDEIGLQAAALPSAGGGARAVLLTHFVIDGSVLPNDRPVSEGIWHEPVLSAHALAGLGYDAIVSGHIERGQLIVSDPPVLYCGSPHAMDFGQEAYEHGCWLLDFADAVQPARFVPLGLGPRFRTLDVDLSRLPADDDPTPLLIGHAGVDGDLDGLLLRLRYKLTEAQARRLDVREVRAALAEAGVRYLDPVPEVIRAQRARVAALTDEVDDVEAFRLWLAEHKVEDPDGRLLAAHLRVLDAVQA